MVGSTSAQTIDEVVKPTPRAQLYNSNEDAKAALESGPDRRTRARPADRVLRDGRRTSRTPSSSASCPRRGIPDEWGIVLAKDSPLTAQVTAAVDALRERRHARRDHGGVARRGRGRHAAEVTVTLQRRAVGARSAAVRYRRIVTDAAPTRAPSSSIGGPTASASRRRSVFVGARLDARLRGASCG